MSKTHTLPEGQVFEEFEEGDPRHGPHSAEAIAEAAELAGAAARWHLRRPHVDWFAIRLQHGRGHARADLVRMFGIGVSTLDRRRYDEAWPVLMAEADRRRLSRLVWLGGLARGLGDDADSRAALRTNSDYSLLPRKTPRVFQLLDPKGAPFQFTFNLDALK